ncbi:uroporphyrinogen-III synthase [Candidatus Protochlamydia amoebophila]|uniref:uroporphyrinogen-III synthase n=1 Tax=Candidatus Protochlamydia amoebophila TaxID=362787 RepID=UPI0000352E00|nr:uroporphyrinogen-III synthase [Candidatus Protochlamydia amoebophila]
MRKILYTGLNPAHYHSTDQLTHCPLIKIIPRPLTDPCIQKAFRDFHLFTHLIFTSKTSIHLLHDHLSHFGLSLDDWKSKTSIAVGQVSGSHLRALGIQPALIAKEETAEGLIIELHPLSLQKASFFWPHSAQARSVLVDFFTDRHLNYYACPFYDTQFRQPEYIPSLEQFDEIVFTSPSTVHAFAKIFGYFPIDKKYVTIGPITLQCLQTYIPQLNS